MMRRVLTIKRSLRGLNITCDPRYARIEDNYAADFKKFRDQILILLEAAAGKTKQRKRPRSNAFGRINYARAVRASAAKAKLIFGPPTPPRADIRIPEED